MEPETPVQEPEGWLVYDGERPSPRRILGGQTATGVWIVVDELIDGGPCHTVAIFDNELDARRWADDESDDPSVIVLFVEWGPI